jgi:signal peptide peptidase SppA
MGHSMPGLAGKGKAGFCARRMPTFSERLKNLVDPPPRIAELRLDGIIAPSGPFGRQALSIERLEPAIRRAFSIPRVAAVALSVNSPGGSAAQSSLIAGRIRALAEEKKVPVLAFVEDVAASGGFWLACAADEIFCDATSIIGSVGVISAGFGFQDAIARIGVERRLYTAGVRKSLLDPFRAEKPEDVARLRDLQGQLHAVFKDYVRSRRGAKLRGDDGSLFEGDIFVGARAVEVGFADGIGTLHATVKARFGERARIVRVGARRRSLLSRFLPLQDAGAGLADGLLAAAESRAAYARFGL